MLKEQQLHAILIPGGNNSKKTGARQSKVTSVLIGASKPEQILDNLRALENLFFTERELAEIDRIVENIV